MTCGKKILDKHLYIVYYITRGTVKRPLGQAVKTSPFHGGNRSSILLGVTNIGSIAQLGEHLPYKQEVTGSSPVAPTIKARVITRAFIYAELFFKRNLYD